jgi:hypothetical protein
LTKQNGHFQNSRESSNQMNDELQKVQYNELLTSLVEAGEALIEN